MDEESLFVAALEKTTANERQAFLDQACAGDAEQRKRVEQLLAAHLRTAGILDHPPADRDDPDRAEPHPEHGPT